MRSKEKQKAFDTARFELHPTYLKAHARRAAMNAIIAKGPHQLRAPVLGGKMSVLVHRSTKKSGAWQATFFDADGEPIGDKQNDDWATLIDSIHYDSVDWAHAEAVGRKARA